MFKIANRYLYIGLLSIYSYFNILLIDGDRLYAFDVNQAYLFLNLLVDVFLIWEGNRLIQSIKIPQIVIFKYKVNRLVINFVLSFLLCLLVSIVTIAISTSLYEQLQKNYMVNFKLSLGFTFRVNLFLHCVNAIVFYINRYSESRLETIDLQKQYAEARFDVLKSQINPHFLFNSFNVLSTLVYKDPDAASEFINEMSKVYRYVLKYQNEKLVSLNQELRFLDAYTYLLKIRFRDNLLIEKKIELDFESNYVVPASLQILIENAVKHNEVSKANPLKITITQSSNKEFLVIRNTVKPIKKEEIDSTEVGLKNIAARYGLLSNKQMQILNGDEFFEVQVPLLKILEYESSNN